MANPGMGEGVTEQSKPCAMPQCSETRMFEKYCGKHQYLICRNGWKPMLLAEHERLERVSAALADALEAAATYVPSDADGTRTKVQAALRAAGRLP